MKLFRTKHYREVPCKACDGKARHVLYIANLRQDELSGFPGVRYIPFRIEVCEHCNGKGTQTVLEKMG